MESKDISVVICTRNRPNMIKQCLQSLMVNTVPPTEIVVVDQSFDDRTQKTVRELSQLSRALQIKYLKMEAEGLTSARNLGTKSSRGEVVAFTDDDCIASPYWIDAITGQFENETVSCVCGHTYPANHLDRPKQAFISTLNIHKRSIFTRRCNAVMVGRGNNMAFRRDVLLKLGGFNERIGMGTGLFAGDDLDIFYRVLDAGGSIAQSPDAIILHSQPDDWESVIRKKRGYAISAAALLGCRLKQGDLYAGLLLAGKISYEFGYLFCGGILRMNRRLASVGWHSFIGSMSGLRQLLNNDLTSEIRELSILARGCVFSDNGRSLSHSTADCVDTAVKDR